MDKQAVRYSDKAWNHLKSLTVVFNTEKVLSVFLREQMSVSFEIVICMTSTAHGLEEDHQDF